MNYKNPDVVSSQILPLFRPGWVFLFGISSQADNPNHQFYRVLKSGILPSLDLKLICDKCFKKNPDAREPCAHNEFYIPYWLNGMKDFIIRDIAGDENDDVYMREILGIMVTSKDRQKCFREESVEYLFEKLPCTVQWPVKDCCVVIDPCAGTQNEILPGSELALCSMITPYTIVGMESFDINRLQCEEGQYKSDLADNIIVQHLREIEKLYYFNRVRFLIGVENNNGMEWDRIPAALKRNNVNFELLGPAYHFKTGLNLNPEKKHDMMIQTKRVLDDHLLSFHTPFICVNDTEGNMKEKLKKQLLTYQVIMKRIENTTTRYHFKLTGKVTKNDQDDACIALQWAVYVLIIFASQGRFGKF